MLLAIAVACAVAARPCPPLRPLFIGLSAVTMPIGIVVSYTVLAVVFYGVLTPIGLVMRLFGRDTMQRRNPARSANVLAGARTRGRRRPILPSVLRRPREIMQDKKSDFATESAGRCSSLVGEFWFFLKHNKKWWMLPLLLVLGLIGALVILGGTGAAPFIYTLF